jgi:hypothetical protein
MGIAANHALHIQHAADFECWLGTPAHLQQQLVLQEAVILEQPSSWESSEVTTGLCINLRLEPAPRLLHGQLAQELQGPITMCTSGWATAGHVSSQRP